MNKTDMVYTIANNAIEVESDGMSMLFVYDTCICRIGIGGEFVRIIRNNVYQDSPKTLRNVNRFRERHGLGKIALKEWRKL